MKLRITVDGKTYEVEAEIIEQDQNPRAHVPTVARAAPSVGVPAPAAAAPTPPADEVADESKVFRSPISGVVVRVSAQVGQTVQANDELMVLEAMKMETVLTSQFAGKVSKINANAGDSVQVKQALVEFE